MNHKTIAHPHSIISSSSSTINQKLRLCSKIKCKSKVKNKISIAYLVTIRMTACLRVAVLKAEVRGLHLRRQRGPSLLRCVRWHSIRVIRWRMHAE